MIYIVISAYHLSASSYLSFNYNLKKERYLFLFIDCFSITFAFQVEQGVDSKNNIFDRFNKGIYESSMIQVQKDHYKTSPMASTQKNLIQFYHDLSYT